MGLHILFFPISHPPLTQHSQPPSLLRPPNYVLLSPAPPSEVR